MVLDNDRYISSELGNITKMLDEHFRVVVSAVRIFSSAISDWLEDNKPVPPKELSKITELEEKGDDIKNSLVNELAQASTLMQREDLLRLVHYNDKLIDGAEIVCYHLAAVAGVWSPNGELKEKINEFNEMVSSIITEQREAVRFLSINMENSLKKANEIGRLEKKIDILLREVIGLLYPAEIEISVLLRIRDLLNTLEEIANLSEDAAITIRVLSLTLNT